MEIIPAVIACLACALTCARVLLFRRAGLRYRWHISLLAWVLAASSGSVAIDIILHRATRISWGEAGMAAVLCIATYLARGNLAHLMRPNHDH